MTPPFQIPDQVCFPWVMVQKLFEFICGIRLSGSILISVLPANAPEDKDLPILFKSPAASSCVR